MIAFGGVKTYKKVKIGVTARSLLILFDRRVVTAHPLDKMVGADKEWTPESRTKSPSEGNDEDSNDPRLLKSNGGGGESRYKLAAATERTYFMSVVSTGLKDLASLVSLSKQRGFVFQSSEIYGGLNSCWDYGPLGSQLKKKH